VQVDAVDAAHLAEQPHQIGRGTLLAHRLAERVAPDVADGPQAKSKMILRARLIVVAGGGAHGATLSSIADWLTADDSVDRLYTHSRMLRQFFANAACRPAAKAQYMHIMTASQPSDTVMVIWDD
jgi:hypothetical protein